MEDIFESSRLKMPELSLLSLEDVQGENKLEVFEKFGLLAELSDLSLIGEADVKSITMPDSLKKYCGYITRSFNYELEEPVPYYIDVDEKIKDKVAGSDILKNSVAFCTRLVLKKIPNYILDYIASNKKINDKGVYEIELGEFFLKEVDRVTENKLNVYANRNERCDKFKLFNERNYDLMLYGNPIYYFEDKYYIRYSSTDGKYHWLEEVPVIWLIDEKTNTLVSKNTFFSVRNSNILEGDYEQYIQEKMLYQMFGYMFGKIYDEFEEKEYEREKEQRFYVRFIKWLKSIWGNKKLAPTSTPNLLPEASTELAIVPEQPKDIVLVEDKKEEKIEIKNEEINRLCDYIKEKSLLLVPSKRKEVLERLNQLLDNHKREMEDLDSEMYVKYNLSLTTPEGSKLTLWDGLNRLKLDVDTFLLDNNNVLNYGEEYIHYLNNLFKEYSAIEDERVYNGMTIRVHATKQLLELINKIECDFNNITPYFRDEILKLILLTLNSIINIPWDSEYSIYYEQRDKLNDTNIADKLILWFEGWYQDNKDKLDDERQRKYLEIKMTMSMENKFAYIVELARIIAPTLITIKEDKKAR